MAQTDPQIYRFEDVEVDLARSVVLRGGEERHLRQQAFQVLTYMLDAGDRLVSKDELFAAVWKNTAVTDDVLVQAVKEIRRVLGDDPHRPRFIKTVRKAGYRFIANVEAETGRNGYSEEITHVEFEYEEDTDPRPPEQRIRAFPAAGITTKWRSYAVASLVTVMLVSAAILYFRWPPASQTAEARLPQVAGRRTVTVMFFDNQTGSADLEWLREGLADMLITNLSRSEKLTVLGREQLKALLDRTGQSPDLPVALENAMAVAQKSGAATIITGSFTRLGEKMRLDVRVYDSATGDLQTTESLVVDRPEQILSDIDLLSLRLVNWLSGGASDISQLAAVMTDDLEAYRYYSLGVAKAHGLANKEAVELLERAIALDRDFAMAHARIGYIYAAGWAQNDRAKPYLEKAFKLSSRLTERDRMNIAAWYALAHLDYGGAIAAYQGIIERFPLDSEAHWRLGTLLLGEERFDEALEVLYQGLKADPDAKNLYNTLGIVLSAKGDHQAAIAAHQRYVALAPNEPNAHDSLGLSYQWAGDHSKAIENYERAIQLDPDFDIAIIHLANARLRLGQYNSAIHLYNRYIAVGGSVLEKARGYQCLSFTYLRKGDLENAEKMAREEARFGPGQIWSLYRVAAGKRQVERARKLALDFLEKSEVLERGARPNRRIDLYAKGTIALDQGRFEEAIDHFRELLRHRPAPWNYDDFEDALGRALLAAGRYDEALAEFDRILRMNPNYPLAYFHVGEAYRAKGMPPEARAAYASFLEAWKDADADIPEVQAARSALSSI